MASSDHSNDTILAGKYRLQEAIGAGGMGSVWRAEHTLLHRAVAVKLIELRGGDPMLAERFLREARVAARVHHPNVVDIIDFGQTDAGQPFMVMELLEGESLLHRMIDDRPPLSTQQIVHVMVQVLMGLDAVHRAGIIHRDLKPGNIFLSYDDDGSIFARLLDFGISYSIDPESQLRRGQFGTDERIITGTPEYMSAEQAEGRPDVDVRADVYSVGVILYELLANGELPYADPNPGGVLFKVMTGVHRPLVELRPDIPELCQVVEGALQHDREKRPATARELRRQLMAAIGLGPDTSGLHFRIETTGERDLRHTPRNTPRPASEHPTLDGLKPSRPSLSAPAPRARWPIAAGLSAAVLVVGLGVWVATRPAAPTPAPAPAPAVVIPPVPVPPVASTPSTPPPAEPAPTAPALAEEPAGEAAPAASAAGTRRRARREDEAASEAAPEAPAEPVEPTAPEAPPAPRPHEIVRELDF